MPTRPASKGTGTGRSVGRRSVIKSGKFITPGADLCIVYIAGAERAAMGRPRIVERLAERVMEHLARDAWEPGGRLPPGRELAREFGVSLTTMQRAMRQLSREGLLKVQPRRPTVVAAGAGARARRLLSRLAGRQASRRLAVLVPEVLMPPSDSSFLTYLAEQLVRECARRAIPARIVPWSLRDQIHAAQSLVLKEFGAVVCIGASEAYLLSLSILHEERFPVLLFNRQFPTLKLPTVRLEDHLAMQRMTDRLIGFGHRRICLVTYHDTDTSQSQAGWINRWINHLDHRGILESSCPPVCYVTRNHGPAMYVRHFLSAPRPATALIFGFSALARTLFLDPGFARARIPEEFSVATFGSAKDVPQRPWRPPLTTMEYDQRRMVECIAETSERMLGGELHPPSMRIPFKVHLTESIGPAPAM
jgi:DNA-binding LacI/PurR family transcriptional regulator